MKYQGSKRRIAKFIKPIVLENRKPGQLYVEPFVGGANMIDKIPPPCLGLDINKYLIALLKKMQQPDFNGMETSEEMWRAAKKHPEYFEDWQVGYLGINLSFSSKWFDGFARNKPGRDYCKNARDNTTKQARLIKNGFAFAHMSYDQLTLHEPAIIYCDPPYRGVTKYPGAGGGFDHDGFWQWCRGMSDEGHSVFVSEYTAPDDFKCVWSREQTTTIARNSKYKSAVERLFVPPLSNFI